MTGPGREKNKKLWGGRFSGSSSDITERLSASIDFDRRLYRHDIRGSIAHAEMLNRIGILNNEELDSIVRGLIEIEAEIDGGIFVFSSSLEDIHMNIESSLTERIGEAGKKLHTARSRNDQIALDMRLYLRDETEEIKKLLRGLIELITEMAGSNIDAVMPGYTHLQVAQPVRFSHHILAYCWMFMRDMGRLLSAGEACMGLPLGSGALAGVNYDSDREYLKTRLGFSRVIPNSMDAVSDRDFILDFLYFASVLGMHLSRLCEEIVLWSTTEFAYIRLADNVTTGSSIMPQKRNPDLAELIRGKSGRLFGNLFSLFTVLKGLPMTYNRDMQEDKESLFDSVDTVKLSLEGICEMLSSVELNKERMRESIYKNFSTATDLADYLARKGVPFRKSHEITGEIVRHCEEKKLDFFRLTLDELRGFSDVFAEDAVEVLSPAASTERKKSSGSTSTEEIGKQLKHIRKWLDEMDSSPGTDS